jgi:hypothetical protein
MGVPSVEAHPAETPEEFDKLAPLKRRPIGVLANDKPGYTLFNEKLTEAPDFKFDGQKGGHAWKLRVSQHLIGRIPAMIEVLKWAERHDQDVIDDACLDAAVGLYIDERQQSELQSQLWSFLAPCLTGSAKTMFGKAPQCNGLDAWRRAIRQIDGGLDLRLEELRREIRVIHMKPMKNLENTHVGIAEFEEKMREFEEAGGDGPSEHNLKSDLLAILPDKLSTDIVIIRQATDRAVSFDVFRDFVLATATRLLFESRRRGGGVHAVVPDVGCVPCNDEAEEETIEAYDADGNFIGAFNRFNKKVGGGGRGSGSGSGTGRPTRFQNKVPANGTAQETRRNPRRCPNCSNEHVGACTEPREEYGDRTCWTCGAKNHSSKDCPKKSQALIKAIEDRAAAAAGSFFGSKVIGSVSPAPAPHPQQRPPKATARKVRPMPRQAMFGDFFPHAHDQCVCTAELCKRRALLRANLLRAGSPRRGP